VQCDGDMTRGFVFSPVCWPSVTRIIAIPWEEGRDWDTMMSDADQDVITQWECQCMLLTPTEHMHKTAKKNCGLK